MKNKYQIASVAMIALAAASLAVPSVYAQTTSAVKKTTQKMAGIHRGPFDHAKMIEDQATVLGITTADLQARLDAGKSFKDIVTDLGLTDDQIKAKMDEKRTAMQAEMKAKIQQEVTDGKLTQAEADLKIADLEKGPQGGLHGEGKGKGRGMMGMKDDSRMLDDKATLLGITVEDLKARLDSGKTCEEIAKDLGITDEVLKTKMEEQRAARLVEMKAKILEEVTSGKLTQEQADQMLERLTNPGKHGFGRGMGQKSGGSDESDGGFRGPRGLKAETSSASASQ